MRDFLRAVEDHGAVAFECLVEAGHHPNVVGAKAEKAGRKGYTEWGVNVVRPWLTEKGREYMRSSRTPAAGS